MTQDRIADESRHVSLEWARLDEEDFWVERLLPLLRARQADLQERIEREEDATALRMYQGALRELRFLMQRPQSERERLRDNEEIHGRGTGVQWSNWRRWFGGERAE